jgi:hypothetical protein
VDDGDQFRGTRTNGGAEFEEQLPFFPLEKDPLLGHSTAEHLVFGFEQLDLPAQFVFCTPCQIE